MKYIVLILFANIFFLSSKSQDLIPIRVDNLWGYMDKQGDIKIKPQYQYASDFIGRIAIVAKNDTLGAIDTKNNIIIPFQYGYLRILDTTELLFGNRSSYYGEYNLGVITHEKKIKVPPEYKYISKFKGTYTVTKELDSTISKNITGDIRSKKSIYGLLDSNGKVIIPCKYEYLDWMNDSILVLTAGSNQALFNKKGEQLTGFEYLVFGKFIEGVAKARIGNKFGFIYPSGKVAIPITFDYSEDFKNGHAIIQQNKMWGAINKKGEIVIAPKFKYEDVKIKLKER